MNVYKTHFTWENQYLVVHVRIETVDLALRGLSMSTVWIFLHCFTWVNCVFKPLCVYFHVCMSCWPDGSAHSQSVLALNTPGFWETLHCPLCRQFHQAHRMLCVCSDHALFFHLSVKTWDPARPVMGHLEHLLFPLFGFCLQMNECTSRRGRGNFKPSGGPASTCPGRSKQQLANKYWWMARGSQSWSHIYLLVCRLYQGDSASDLGSPDISICSLQGGF